MGRKEREQRRAGALPQASPGVEAPEAASAEPEALALEGEAVMAEGLDEGPQPLLEAASDEDMADLKDAAPLPPEVMVFEPIAPLPREPGFLPGSVLCVVKHGTLRRHGVVHEMGAEVEMPQAEAEELLPYGTIDVR